MNLVTVALKNLTRNKLRAALTMGGVAVVVLFFMLLRTVVWSWNTGTERSASDRIGVRHKVTFTMTLPKRYTDDVRAVAGVTSAVQMNWFGAKDPNNERDFFATLATDPEQLLNVYDDMRVPPAQLEAWKQNRRGALVGDVLAKRRGWKVGDKVTLEGTIFPGPWEFQISGIYTATRSAVDRTTFYFDWDYMNESIEVERRDQIGWVVARIAEPSRSAEITHAIDEKFAERDIQTVSMSEKALQASFLGMLSAVLAGIDVVSVVILAIMTLILGNTIAMGVRERTNEYGVLRAIGFLPRHIVVFVIGESITLGLVGGALGVALAYPFVERGFGRFLEENMSAAFPVFRVQLSIVGVVFLVILVLSAIAGAIPAYGASKLKVVDSLRRVA